MRGGQIIQMICRRHSCIVPECEGEEHLQDARLLVHRVAEGEREARVLSALGLSRVSPKNVHGRMVGVTVLIGYSTVFLFGNIYCMYLYK